MSCEPRTISKLAYGHLTPEQIIDDREHCHNMLGRCLEFAYFECEGCKANRQTRQAAREQIFTPRRTTGQVKPFDDTLSFERERDVWVFGERDDRNDEYNDD
jgi:hypothetical protein